MTAPLQEFTVLLPDDGVPDKRVFATGFYVSLGGELVFYTNGEPSLRIFARGCWEEVRPV